eukprot:COSAG02_NODE_2781_length_8038_cov_3.889533_2_plen_232_part_00
MPSVTRGKRPFAPSQWPEPLLSDCDKSASQKHLVATAAQTSPPNSLHDAVFKTVSCSGLPTARQLVPRPTDCGLGRIGSGRPCDSALCRVHRWLTTGIRPYARYQPKLTPKDAARCGGLGGLEKDRKVASATSRRPTASYGCKLLPCTSRCAKSAMNQFVVCQMNLFLTSYNRWQCVRRHLKQAVVNLYPAAGFLLALLGSIHSPSVDQGSTLRMCKRFGSQMTSRACPDQ